MKERVSKVERLRRLLDRAIFASLLALVVLVAVPYGSVDPVWEGAFGGAVFIVGALWMIEGAAGGRWFVEGHRMLVPLVVLTVFAAAQSLPLLGVETVAGVEVRRAISADPIETVRAAMKLAALTLALALLLRYVSSERRLRALVWALVVVGVASALFGVARQTTRGGAAEFFSQRLAANVYGYGQFFNRNHFAFFMEMALGAAAGLLVGARRERVLVYLAAALPVWAALVLSNSRGGILGMFALTAVAALVYFARVRRRREESGRAEERSWGETLSNSFLFRAASLGVLLTVVLAGVLWTGGERLASRLEALPSDVSAGQSKVRWGDRRVEIWGATVKLIRDYPLTGVGFGAYRAAVTKHHDASGEMSLEQAHNDYLELLASGGLVGAGLAAWFGFEFVRRARRRLRGRGLSRRGLCAGALAGLAAVAVHSLFDFGLHVTANALACVVLVAVATIEVPVAEKAHTRRRQPQRQAEREAVAA